VKSVFRQVLFDLDGTLIDHFEAIHEAYRFAQDRLGLAPASLEKVRRTVGGSVPVTMRRLIGAKAGQETIDEALELFDRRFGEIMFERVSVLPGVAGLLERLRGKNVPMAVFTNKKGTHARAVLVHLGLDGFFGSVVGAGDTPFRKPEPEFTDHILEVTGSPPSETLLIGDSPFDVEAGKVRSLPVAAVATGSHTSEQLAETEADWIFADMDDLSANLFGAG